MKNIIYISFILLLLSCSNDEVIKRSSVIMGSIVEIQVKGINSVTANRAITASFEEAKRIDTLFSTYIDGNQMWMLNNTNVDEIVVNSEMFTILKKSEEIWQLTNGSFDPAIGSLIDLYNFEKDSPKIPTAKQIKDALKINGWKNILLKEGNIIVKPENIKLNFNAIVPGYAADRIANLLSNFGIKEYLINVGGEIFARGENWTVGIQHPRKENQLLYTININGMGVSTSGDYEQYFSKDGKRYSHLINPLTGLPADQCEAVTIITKETLLADALSTGVFILGPKKGLELIEKLENVEGIIVDTTGQVYESSGFKKFITKK